jgi:hypothetical protein
VRDGGGGGGCGHHAVRHLQDAQLRKVLGAAQYDAAHRRLRQQAASAHAVLGGGMQPAAASQPAAQQQPQQRRRLQAADSSTAVALPQPLSRLQRLLAGASAAPLRMTPVFQLQDSYLSTAQAAQLRDVLVPGAMRVLQQYIKVCVCVCVCVCARAHVCMVEASAGMCCLVWRHCLLAPVLHATHLRVLTHKHTARCSPRTIAPRDRQRTRSCACPPAAPWWRRGRSRTSTAARRTRAQCSGVCALCGASVCGCCLCTWHARMCTGRVPPFAIAHLPCLHP